MRNSERVLNSLAIHSRQPNYKFERLYRLLFNEQMYYAAYQRIYAKSGLPLIVIATVISMIILPIAFPFYP